VIFLDTSLLVDALSGAEQSAAALRRAMQEGERIQLSSLVIYEWLRGPRVPQELAAQEALFPSEAAVPFGWRDAALSAKLYRSVRRARGREADIAIAACAITHEAQLWTLNTADFKDIPGLRLYSPI
jgi:predicted nucleic acid-binding protein